MVDILECKRGTYGSECKHNCSRHCFNDLACNRTNGICDMGCKAGYKGQKCDTGFILTYYTSFITVFIKLLVHESDEVKP